MNTTKQSSSTSEQQPLADGGTQSITRREFLKSGALAVAASTVATPRLVAADTAPKQIRMAVVGGGFGTSF